MSAAWAASAGLPSTSSSMATTVSAPRTMASGPTARARRRPSIVRGGRPAARATRRDGASRRRRRGGRRTPGPARRAGPSGAARPTPAPAEPPRCQPPEVIASAPRPRSRPSSGVFVEAVGQRHRPGAVLVAPRQAHRLRRQLERGVEVVEATVELVERPHLVEVTPHVADRPHSPAGTSRCACGCRGRRPARRRGRRDAGRGRGWSRPRPPRGGAGRTGRPANASASSPKSHGRPRQPRPTTTPSQPVVPDHRQGVLGLPDVAVAEHGDRRHRRLQRGDRVPVGVAGVELLGGAGMEGDGRDALVLGDAAGVEEREVVLVDALAELDRHRDVAGGRDDRGDDAAQQRALERAGPPHRRDGSPSSRGSRSSCRCGRPRRSSSRRRTASLSVAGSVAVELDRRGRSSSVNRAMAMVRSWPSIRARGRDHLADEQAVAVGSGTSLGTRRW